MINWKGAVILLAIVTVLAVHLYQTRGQTGPPGPVAKTFVGCTSADTVELQLTRAVDGKVVDLKRPTSVDHWSIVGAAGGPANDSDVDGILTELHTLMPSDRKNRYSAALIEMAITGWTRCINAPTATPRPLPNSATSATINKVTSQYTPAGCTQPIRLAMINTSAPRTKVMINCNRSYPPI